MIKEGTSANFETEVLSANGKILVDFFATWCGPCKMQGKLFEDMIKDGKDIPIVKVDVDKNSEIAIKYSISLLPTLCVFEGGKEIKRMVGLSSESEILDAMK